MDRGRPITNGPGCLTVNGGSFVYGKRFTRLSFREPYSLVRLLSGEFWIKINEKNLRLKKHPTPFFRVNIFAGQPRTSSYGPSLRSFEFVGSYYLKWKWSTRVSRLSSPWLFHRPRYVFNPVICHFRFLSAVAGNRAGHRRLRFHRDRRRIHRPPQWHDGQRVRHGLSILSKTPE